MKILCLVFALATSALGAAGDKPAATAKSNAVAVATNDVVEVGQDVADVPALNLRIGGDAMKRVFLIGLRTNTPAASVPYRLLLVLPGGDGGANFTSFVRRIHKYALNERWLVAQLIAPAWDNSQKFMVVWPSKTVPYPKAKFLTEEFIDAVIADVKKRAPIDSKNIFALAWSSGGPAVYSAALREESPLAGAFVAMSVWPGRAATEKSKDKSFYLLQSPDDEITPFAHAEQARDALLAGGARVHLQSYAGGHGWRGPVWPMMRQGIRWLDERQ